MGISQQIGASSLGKPGVCTSTTRPATPYEGQMIYETDTDKVLVYNGTAWVYSVIASPTFTGVPAAPTATPGTSTTQLATTAFVTSAVASVGMWKISTTSLSGVTTNISNCFSSTYANYRVLVTNLNNSTATLRSLSIRFRTTSDDTASNYNYGTFGMFGVSTQFAGAAANQNSAVIGAISAQPTGNAASGFTIDILSPNTVSGTTYTGTLLTYQADTASFVYRSIGGNNTTTTQYTGFSIIGVTDSLSGTVQVYGYN